MLDRTRPARNLAEQAEVGLHVIARQRLKDLKDRRRGRELYSAVPFAGTLRQVVSMTTAPSYNPLDQQNLAASIVDALLQRKPVALPPPKFRGAGIYAIY